MNPCNNHNVVQHRDAKEPWCDACGLTERFTNPKPASSGNPNNVEVCSNHAPTDNSDGKEDWCWTCGLNDDFRDPKALDSPFYSQEAFSVFDAETMTDEQILAKVMDLGHQSRELDESFKNLRAAFEQVAKRLRVINKSLAVFNDEINRRK